MVMFLIVSEGQKPLDIGFAMSFKELKLLRLPQYLILKVKMLNAKS